MKIPPLLFVLVFIAGVCLPARAAISDFRTSPSADVSPSSRSDRDSPNGPQVDSSRRGRLEDTVEIVGVAVQPPDANARCKVAVRVRYALVHYPKGVLTLGFNLKTATSFSQVATRPVMAGSEEVEISATIVPVVWPKRQPFKLYVGLSAEPHPGQWSLLAAINQVLKPSVASTPDKSRR